MRKPTKSKWITVRQSKIHRKGVFAKKNIPKGTKVIEYVAEKMTKKQSDDVADLHMEKSKNHTADGGVYIFELNSRHDVNGKVPYNTARLINHSCDPNCETDIIKGHIWIIAIKDIKKGDELNYDYGYEYDTDYDEHPCKCRAKKCVGYIVAQEDWTKLRRRLRQTGKV